MPEITVHQRDTTVSIDLMEITPAQRSKITVHQRDTTVSIDLMEITPAQRSKIPLRHLEFLAEPLLRTRGARPAQQKHGDRGKRRR